MPSFPGAGRWIPVGGSGYRIDVTAYRVIWHCLAGLLCVVGVAAAVVVVPVATLVALTICVGLVSGLIGLSIFLIREDEGEPQQHLPRRVVTVGCLGGVVAVAITGLQVVIGAVALALAAIFAAGSPTVVGSYLRRHRPATIHTSRSRAAGEPELAAFSNAELCRAWLNSFDALRVAATPSIRLQIVQARQAYLDELERRDPDGLRAWLESNASPAGNPARFVGGSDRDH
jgi:hypothetical protein